MPALRTPRISPTFSVMPVPGMNVPGGANTPFMPVRAFGAPQTTRTVSLPVSTVHTRSRSAFGCCTASITRAMRNGARAAPRSSTPSSSRPMRVSVSVIWSSVASVSRCVFSQERVNFIAHTPSCSMVGASGLKAVVAQPADVGFEERAQIGHAVLQHGDALDAHAPGEPLPLARIDAAVGQHARMHHAAAEDLQPVAAAAEFAGAAVPADVHLHRRLGEREVAGAEAHRQIGDAEEGAEEVDQRALQVAEM